MVEAVGEAFLSSVFQVIRERLASRDFRDYFHERVGKKFEIILDSINRVLDDAETKQYQMQNVKKWLDDLKYEAYEVEQLLDAIAIDAQQKGKILRFFSGFIKRFNRRIKVLLKRLEVLADQKDILGLQEATRAEGRVSRRLLSEFPTASSVDESDIYGRENEKEEIIEFLLADNGSDNQVSIISVVGLMGMGKTTLAQLVYNDHRIKKQFDHIAWVHVSESFDLIRLTRSILDTFLSSVADFTFFGKNSSIADSEDLDILQRQLQQSSINHEIHPATSFKAIGGE
ncbi:hypothetical protein TSUD_120150 [Trifolium subterraneum]|uniref:NB-ARC domain-containing protein n=1 Tax=Trifolium subterraneum TaxID=3900 RepID=A0A2Z6P9H4_TRISU|nr:hypothetical protein TSUD_120150 [Trifolium subterraneum]